MSTNSKIEWTDATWNPVTGCAKVSPGCDHCYAERITNRFGGPGAFDTVTLHPDRLDMPLRWRRPRMVFVNSMSDLFHQDVPDDYVASMFAVMAAASGHTFQVLTKRHARMRSLLDSATFLERVKTAWRDRFLRPPFGAVWPGWPLPNVWLGVSVEDQRWADIRIPALLDTPATVRFLSCEPLLGPVDLRSWPYLDVAEDGYSPINWVIVGGESGPHARPMHPQWPRQLRDQCVAAGVPFFFKQWGEWAPERPANWRSYGADRRWSALPDGTAYDPRKPDMYHDPALASMFRVGKQAAGRLLDGRTWDEYPQLVSP